MNKKLFPRKALAAAVAVIGLVAGASGCTNDVNWSGTPDGPRPITAMPPQARITLAGFDNCEDDLAEMQVTRRRVAEQQAWSGADVARSSADEDASGVAAGTAARPATEAPAAESSDMDASPPAPNVDTGTGTEQSQSFSADGTGTDATQEAAGAKDDATGNERVVGTNVQEEGVDEADMIKTDGRRIVTLSAAALRIVVLDDDPQVDGTLQLGPESGANQMYLVGDRVFILGSVFDESFYGPMAEDGAATDRFYPGSAQTRITQIDISDAKNPKVDKTVTIEGSLVDSRSVGESLHVVLTSDSANVLPMMTEDGAAAATTLGGCDDVRFESMSGSVDSTGFDAAGFDAATQSAEVPFNSSTVSILSFKDLDKSIEPTVIEGTGGVVYASTGSLYVASPQWDKGMDATALHRFALNSDGPSQYVASGLVPGQMLNQFSASEFDGVLRVVTNVTGLGGDQPVTMPGAVIDDMAVDPAQAELIGPDAPDSSSSEPGPAVAWGPTTELTTLGISDMRPLGKVSDLAPGEQVQSSRFIGPMAYVVTFRQVDPLFAIDVSDPTNPRVLGELKIPGFSQYMHPVGENLLLGVGRDVDPNSAQDLGLKLSLFDVSDPAQPKEIDTWRAEAAYSPVDGDHHAFTWDAQNRRAFLPVQESCPMPNDDGAARGIYIGCESMKVFGISNGRITQQAQIVHLPPGLEGLAPIRSIIIGQTIWTLSDHGLGHSPIGNPSEVTLIRFQ